MICCCKADDGERMLTVSMGSLMTDEEHNARSASDAVVLDGEPVTPVTLGGAVPGRDDVAENTDDIAADVNVDQFLPEVDQQKADSYFAEATGNVDAAHSETNKQCFSEEQEKTLCNRAAVEQGPPRSGGESFEAKLKRSNLALGWGWSLDALESSGLYICRLQARVGANSEESPIDVYNRTAVPERRIRVGDYVTGVTGVDDNTSSPQDMMKALQSREEIKVRVVRASLFTRKIIRESATLGIGIKYGPGGTTLVIASLKPDGAVAQSAPDVKPGDRILEVNGASGTPNAIMEMMEGKDVLEFTLSRLSS